MTTPVLPNGHLPEAIPMVQWERQEEERQRRASQKAKEQTGGEPPQKDEKKVTWAESAAALDAKEFKPVPYIIPGYVAPGLTLLVGKPKIGKSWLALGWALSVAQGGYVMGSIPVERAAVLYLALEDTERRLQKRFRQMLPGEKPPANLFYVTGTEREWPRGQAAIDAIDAEISAIDNAKLVFVDVLAKVMPLRNNKTDVYQADYAAMTLLKRYADQKGIAIVGIHHVSKRMDGDDPFDAVSGSTGLTGAADTVIILSRDSQGMKIYGRGRDVEEIDTAVAFDLSTGFFSTLGNTAEVRRSDERRRILDAMRQAGGDMRPAEIAAGTGIKANNVRPLLFKMARDGQVVKGEKYGTYRLPLAAAAGTATGNTSTPNGNTSGPTGNTSGNSSDLFKSSNYNHASQGN